MQMAQIVKKNDKVLLQFKSRIKNGVLFILTSYFYRLMYLISFNINLLLT
jgi:hypothetical protein